MVRSLYTTLVWILLPALSLASLIVYLSDFKAKNRCSYAGPTQIWSFLLTFLSAAILFIRLLKLYTCWTASLLVIFMLAGIPMS